MARNKYIFQNSHRLWLFFVPLCWLHSLAIYLFFDPRTNSLIAFKKSRHGSELSSFRNSVYVLTQI